MIKINDQFSIKKDPHCWVLNESKEVKGKQTIKSTYHANIPQICEAILNKSAGDCKSVEDLNDLYLNAVERLTENINNKIKPKRKRVRK